MNVSLTVELTDWTTSPPTVRAVTVLAIGTDLETILRDVANAPMFRGQDPVIKDYQILEPLPDNDLGEQVWPWPAGRIQ